MATYKDIRNFVKEKYGFYPQPCWIAHMKEVCGIPVRVAHNRFSLKKNENGLVHQTRWKRLKMHLLILK